VGCGGLIVLALGGLLLFMTLPAMHRAKQRAQEMWCRFPGGGQYFSRGLSDTLTGSSEWGWHQTPFLLRKGQRPDLVRLNLVVEGAGKVWIRDVELRAAELK
jgi:hypothetical protein